jgi:L-iditol 2-dehydrogenase
VRALLFYGPGDLRLEDIPEPEPELGDVVVQVEVALTDGTDAKTFERGHPILLGELPSLFGHEFCGVDVRSGRRVVAANSAPCGQCPPCRRGQEELCANLYPLLNGAYAEYVLVPAHIAERNLLPVPAGLASEVAAMIEPLACCLHGVERAKIEAGQTVAVLGPGPIGLMLCAAARDAGANVVVVGGRPERQELAGAFGAAVGDGQGADVVIEAAGTEESWADAVELVRAGGKVVFFGGRERGSDLSVDTYRLHYEELTLLGSFHHTPRTVRAALAFLGSGAHPWERLITHQIGLDEVAGLFEDPPGDLLKAAVRP